MSDPNEHVTLTMVPRPSRSTTGLALPALVAVACMMCLPLLAGGWERVFEAENLLVDRREYPGSELQEIRGVTRLQASLNAVMALLKDAAFNEHWVYRSGGARILKENGYAQAYVYGVVDAPWPIQDRDTVVRFAYRQDPDTRVITITISNFPDFLPVQEQFVRVPDFGGYWQLAPQADGWLEVTYQVHGNPGGWIPVWLANYAAVASVTRTLQNMATAVAHYRGAQSAFVQEP
jgi:ribosomal protein L25 (general stress protein Ctc)